MSRPHRLNIDFAGAGNGFPWSALAVLVAGLGACLLVILSHQQTLHRVAQLEATYSAQAPRRPAADAAASSAGQRRQGEAIQRANAVARELARRWDRVFATLETANTPEVALLAIEPDPRKSVLRLTAEARRKKDMLDYVARLQEAQPLRRVVLERHDVLVDAAEKPVRFIVSASWEMEP